MSGPSADKDVTLERLERWRAEALALGGMPTSHPHVPSDYVYMANRMVRVIDDLIRAVNYVIPPEGERP